MFNMGILIDLACAALIIFIISTLFSCGVVALTAYKTLKDEF